MSKKKKDCDSCNSCDKKELIKKAAVRLFAEKGFHSTSTDHIAREAKVAVGTIYNYFNNKENILSYIIEIEMKERKQFFCHIDQENLHPFEKIRELLNMHFKRVKENPDIAKIILKERSFPDKCYLYGDEKPFEGMPLFIISLLEQAQKEGKLKECNLKIVSLTLFGALEAIMGRYIYELEQKIETDLLDYAADEMVRILWVGLARRVEKIDWDSLQICEADLQK